MLKSLFTSKSFIIAVCIFIFVCAACFMYYNAVSLQISKDASEHETYIRSLVENTGDIDTPQRTGDVSGDEIVGDSSDILAKQKETLRVSENGSDTAPSDKKSQSVMPEISEKEVRMSPFGLGPLPEIPEGWPGRGFVNNQTIGHELIERVRIKMFADKGEYYSGGTIDHDTGLVRLTSKDRIYVSWGYVNINGVPTPYISGMSAHPETGDKIRSNAKARQSETPVELRTRRRPLLLEEDIPTGVEILSLDSGGINPYEFLGLERR